MPKMVQQLNLYATLDPHLVPTDSAFNTRMRWFQSPSLSGLNLRSLRTYITA
jgi:hypothetical protein